MVHTDFTSGKLGFPRREINSVPIQFLLVIMKVEIFNPFAEGGILHRPDIAYTLHINVERLA